MVSRYPLLLALLLGVSACATEPQAAASDAASASPASAATATEAPPAPATLQPAALGKPAPAFELPTLDGGKVSLAAHRGKVVVLEWFNPDCPFVNQAHLEGNLKGLAKKHPEVVWIAINSNAAGKQGHEPERNRAGRERFGIDYPIALDADGAVGKAYGATRTPEIYVIDPEGNLVYRGALDSTSGGDLADQPDAKNYVEMALEDLAEKRPLREAETKAWGCSVKYGSS
ncbi:MAG: redoxin family protein [Polyangiaceae bacterium]